MTTCAHFQHAPGLNIAQITSYLIIVLSFASIIHLNLSTVNLNCQWGSDPISFDPTTKKDVHVINRRRRPECYHVHMGFIIQLDSASFRASASEIMFHASVSCGQRYLSSIGFIRLVNARGINRTSTSS